MDSSSAASELPELLPRLRAVVARVAGRTEVEDALQECCVRILQKEHLYREEGGSFASWARTVARHRTLSFLRSPWRSREEGLGEGDVLTPAREPSIDEERVSWTLDQLGRLPEPERELLRLRYFDGLTVEEVGQRLGISQAGASGRLARAVELLQVRARRQGLLATFLPVSWAAGLAGTSKMKLTLVATSTLAATAAAGSFFLPDPDTPVQGPTVQLERTTFAPSLTSSFDPAKNTLWCGTMPLAWKALIEASGRRFDESALRGIGSEIHADPFDGSQIDPLSHISVAGFDTKQVVEEAQRLVQQRFGRGRDPVLDSWAPEGVLAYAFLAKAMKFPVAFEDHADMSFGFGEGERAQDVESFGIADFDYSIDLHKELFEQVRVLHYASPQEFVLELIPQGRDRIVLARGMRGATLEETWKKIRRRREAYPRLGQSERSRLILSNGETFRLPKLDLDLSHVFEGFSLPLRDEIVPLNALQTIRVRLDEKGAEVRSRVMMLRASASDSQKRLVFDGPFLTAFLEEGADWPYCMVWVADAELLVPRALPEER